MRVAHKVTEKLLFNMPIHLGWQ